MAARSRYPEATQGLPEYAATAQEAAEILGVAVTTLYGLAQRAPVSFGTSRRRGGIRPTLDITDRIAAPACVRCGAQVFSRAGAWGRFARAGAGWPAAA